jgi:hypothetical protein
MKQSTLIVERTIISSNLKKIVSKCVSDIDAATRCKFLRTELQRRLVKHPLREQVHQSTTRRVQIIAEEEGELEPFFYLHVCCTLRSMLRWLHMCCAACCADCTCAVQRAALTARVLCSVLRWLYVRWLIKYGIVRLQKSVKPKITESVFRFEDVNENMHVV